MNPRKNPKYDLEKKRGLFLSIGLCVSMGLTLTAFEYALPVSKDHTDDPPIDLFEEVVFDVPQTKHKEPQPPKKQKIVIHPSIVVTTTIDQEDVKAIFTPTDDEKPQEAVAGVDNGGDEIPEEEIEEAPANWAEKMPIPTGGMESFYKFLKKNLKYPSQAKRMGIEGKVFVKFVVDKNGQVSRISIIKGIGAGCDEEAAKVIEQYPSWKPGRQGNYPVAVWMVMPIHFKLGN